MQQGYASSQESRPPALSVSAAMALAKGALEQVTVRIVGEVCELNNKPGYKAIYFSVKDEQAVLPCMMWLNRYNANGLQFKLGDVLELTGRFTLYAAKGRMSFDVFSFVAAGEGTLRMRVAILAKKLQAEGLMDSSRKRRVPAYPARIGLVTSPRGAAVHDVFRTLRRRFPVAQVLFAGVPVEGVDAPRRIIEGLHCVEHAGAEVILVVRGGGSYEDLMPYNDESLARAIAACSVPVVTGIGHEPDTSIADMVADVRASTPTAAAEAVSPSQADLDAYFGNAANLLDAGITRTMTACSHAVQIRAQKPLFAHPALMYESQALYLDGALQRLERLQQQVLDPSRKHLDGAQLELKHTGEALLHEPARRIAVDQALLRQASEQLLDSARHQVELGASRLQDLSPLNTIARGWTMTRKADGSLVTSVSQVKPDEVIDVSVRDGEVRARVIACFSKPYSTEDNQ